jgi:hypothetical protein
MKSRYTSKNRNELKLEIANVFQQNMQMLSKDLQEILLDDLVTAFENRLTVLKRSRSDLRFELAESFEHEKVKT